MQFEGVAFVSSQMEEAITLKITTPLPSFINSAEFYSIQETIQHGATAGGVRKMPPRRSNCIP